MYSANFLKPYAGSVFCFFLVAVEIGRKTKDKESVGRSRKILIKY